MQSDKETTEKIDFLTSQSNKLSKYGIVHRSIKVELSYDEAHEKFKKKPLFNFGYRNKQLKSSFDKKLNSMIIPMGKNYNHLIGIDVDNKGNTLKFFYRLCREYNYSLNTLTMKTINGGKHFYFYLDDNQKELLDDFMSADGKCFSNENNDIHIDIKYTNQILFGPSYFSYNGEIKKYEILTNVKPDCLPKFIFDEIYRVHKTQPKTKPKTKLKEKPIAKPKAKQQKSTKEKINHIKTVESKDESNEESNDESNKESNEESNDESNEESNEESNGYSEESEESDEDENTKRLRLYLDNLNPKRFDDRNDWMIIGAIIYNEINTYNLFDEYSRKSKKYNRRECQKMWNSFNRDRNKKATIKKLIEMAEKDNKKDNQKLLLMEALDKTRTLNNLFSFGPTDTTLSFLFYEGNQTNIIYDKNSKKFYVRNEYGIFIEDKNREIIKSSIGVFIRRTIENEMKAIRCSDKYSDDKKNKMIIIGNKIIRHSSGSRNKDNIVDELRILYMTQQFDKIMDKNPFLVGFNNGVYDLQNMSFRIAEKGDYVSVTTGYNYNKPNEERRAEAYELLKTIFPDEIELRYILKHISLGLFGMNPEERFYVWIGNASNGKGILRDIIMTVLGDYYDSMDISYLYKSDKKNSNSANSVMARKKNVRIVITTEPDTSQRLDSDLIKQITGGDPQQVRELYGSSFNFTPLFSLVIQTNNEPSFNAFDDGIKRRVVLIKFPIKFVENPTKPNEKKIDTSLKRKITKEHMFINEFFDIFAEHHSYYMLEGMELPPRFKQDTANLIQDNSPFDCWFSARITITKKPKERILSSDIFDDFKEFMEGDTKGIDNKKFKAHMLSKDIEQKRLSDGMFYIGIVFKEIIEDD